jgi:hypothetical protein
MLRAMEVSIYCPCFGQSPHELLPDYRARIGVIDPSWNTKEQILTIEIYAAGSESETLPQVEVGMSLIVRQLRVGATLLILLGVAYKPHNRSKVPLEN